MAKATQPKPKRNAAPKNASVGDAAPVDLKEPSKSGGGEAEMPWLRGLQMLLFVILVYLAQWVLLIAAVVQFFWLLFAREKNGHIASFGNAFGKWLNDVARFQTAVSEDKPFPFRPWGS